VPAARGQAGENGQPGGRDPASVPAGPRGKPPPCPPGTAPPSGRQQTVPRQPVAAAMEDPEFREYVTARGRSLLKIAYLLTGNSADAEDLVQSALAKTYQAWGRIEDRSAIDGYVRRTIVNTHISWWRRRRLNEYPTDEIPDQAIADPSGDADLQDSVRRAIDRLPQRMRAAVLLRFYEDMTEAQIAARLGISVGTVKSTVSRAVAKLRIDDQLLAD
jgi:RNA polymerase sigma-70 factor (sigma-E family)